MSPSGHEDSSGYECLLGLGGRSIRDRPACPGCGRRPDFNGGLGRALFGFHNGSRLDYNLAVLQRFLRESYVQVVTLTFTTAERFGEISTSLRKRGRPIPSNDIWIAAQAFEHTAKLVSSDSHFELVENLSWSRLPPR